MGEGSHSPVPSTRHYKWEVISLAILWRGVGLWFPMTCTNMYLCLVDFPHNECLERDGTPTLRCKRTLDRPSFFREDLVMKIYL